MFGLRNTGLRVVGIRAGGLVSSARASTRASTRTLHNSNFGTRNLRHSQIPFAIPRSFKRSLNLSSSQLQAAKGWGTILNILGGAYIGGLLVCLGLLYLIYDDANDRQHIPFELKFQDQITAVKAISKDDVLKSPKYAVKHYRRLLIELAKQEDPDSQFDEEDPENKYRVPLLSSEKLLHSKSNAFSNFYIDIVSRYAKALLAKGMLDISQETLKKLVYNDDIFYRLGDAERLSQCCRLLSKISDSPQEGEMLIRRSISMIEKTFSSIALDQEFRLKPQSRITDELMNCLNDLAFNYGLQSKQGDKQKNLDKAMNIYLSNLKFLQTLHKNLDNGTISQSKYPLFNCQDENLIMKINEIRGHLSEVVWAKGYKKNAISWAEEIVDDIYYQRSTSKRANQILYNVLDNLVFMYKDIKNSKSMDRCKLLQQELTLYDMNQLSWYDNLINRFCKIIYHKGPLGVLEKELLERFGPSKRLLEIEEFEEEDKE